MLDPFTIVTQQLIAILRNCPAMTGALGIGVKPENVIDLTEASKAQDHPVPTPTAGQTPQILVLPSRGLFSPYGRNSLIAEAARTWILAITTDTLRLGGENRNGPITLFSVEWAMMLAFVGIAPDLGVNALNGLTKVRKYNPLVVAERGLLDDFPALSRDTPRRWTAVLAIEVEMYWGSLDLFNYVHSLVVS